jgi:hypothetical protein
MNFLVFYLELKLQNCTANRILLIEQARLENWSFYPKIPKTFFTTLPLSSFRGFLLVPH